MLDTQAVSEPEGADYILRLRTLADSLAQDIELPVQPLNSTYIKNIESVYGAIGLVTSFPVRADVVDNLDDEGERELVQLMQLLIEVSWRRGILCTMHHCRRSNAIVVHFATRPRAV